MSKDTITKKSSQGEFSRLLGRKARSITPYVPGEQRQDRKYIKLNTNELPYPPSPAVSAAIKNFDPARLTVYPDPLSAALKAAAADFYKIDKSMVFVGGGSDEVLGFAFAAFADKGDKVYFPDVTYGFYSVYADLFGLSSVEIPLEEDFTIDIEKYKNLDGNIFIANPNAPTGIALPLSKIEEIVCSNPDNLVVIDEAYIDFSAEKSAVELTLKYDNLLVVQTFSKSRALAGMRLGFGFASPEIISGLERIKFSFNPYNLDHISSEVGTASLSDREYFNESVGKVVKTRERFSAKLEMLGFSVIPSAANFVFTSHSRLAAKEIFENLRENGVLTRHFDSPRTYNYLRISIGTESDMDEVIKVLESFIMKG